MNRFSKQIDFCVALCGSLVGVLIIYLSYFYKIHQYDVGLTVLIASIIYITFKKEFVISEEKFFVEYKKQKLVIINIIYIMSFTGSIWILFSELYIRPFIYFILVSIASGSVFYEIQYSKEKDSWNILTKILLLAFSIRGGIYYEFPSLYGTDPYWHLRIINVWIETGFNTVIETFAGNNQYFSYPVMHISVTIMKILSSLNIKNSYYFVVGFYNVISIMFIYLLGKKLVNYQCGLLSSLIICISDYHIYYGSWIIPTSLGITLVYIITYIVFEKKHPVIYKCFFILFSLLLILSHTLSSLIMLIILFSISVGKLFYNKVINLPNCASVCDFLGNAGSEFTSIILFGSMMIGYWSYNSYNSSMSFLNMISKAFLNVINDDVEIANAAKVSVKVVESNFEYILNNIGYLILLFLALVGLMLWMSYEKRNIQRIAIAITTLIMFIFIYGFPLFGLRIIFSGRWFAFVYMFISILASYFVLIGSYKIKKSKYNIIIINLLFIILSFSMVTNTLTNNDSPMYAEEEASRIGYTHSELKGAEKLANTCENITTDTYYGAVIYYLFESNSNLTYFNTNNSLNSNKELVIIRDYAKYNPIQMKNEEGLQFAKKLDEDYIEKYKSDKYDLVYKNSLIEAYRRSI